MIIDNLAATTEQYYVRKDGSSKYLSGKLGPQSFDRVDAGVLGAPPYTVTLRCNGIEGIMTDDVVVSWTAPGAKGITASYPNKSLAEGAE